MDRAVNFYELKTELEGIGMHGPQFVNNLRSALYSGKDWFSLDTLVLTDRETLHLSLDFAVDADGRLSLAHYAGVIVPGRNAGWTACSQLRDQVFRPDVPLAEALSLLQARLTRAEVSAMISVIPMPRQEVRASLGLPLNQSTAHLVNQKTMNTENLEFLQKNLLNLGFGDKANAEMEKLIKARAPEFSVTLEQEYNSRKMDYTLHFKAGGQNEMYFFNRYEASLKNEADPTKERTQTMYINKGHGITAKEAFNLLEGRSVEKKLYNKENEPYTAWLKLDFKEKDDYGNHLLHKFSERYGYDLEKTLAQYPIKQLDDPQQKEELLRSLRKGNAQQVSMEKDGQTHKYYLVAEPQYKQVNIYDSQMKSVKRESLKQDSSLEQSQSQSKKQSRKNQQDESPQKQQSRKQKVH